MSDSPQPAKIPDEELIAYLDGELDDAGCRRIEQLLMTDPHLRRRLQELERCWELLDQLEPPPPDERLTRSTLEMVAVEAAQQAELLGPAVWWRRWLWPGLVLVSLLTATALGVALGWSWAPDPDRQLLEDLLLLENLDCYRQIDDFQFLKALQERGIFQEEGADEG
jgi:anti-sigma factor RsiW